MQQHKGARQEREVLATNVNAVPICLIRARSVEDQPPMPVQFGFWQGKRVDSAEADINIRNRSSSRLVVVGCLAAKTIAPRHSRRGWSNRR